MEKQAFYKSKAKKNQIIGKKEQLRCRIQQILLLSIDRALGNQVRCVLGNSIYSHKQHQGSKGIRQ